MNLDIERLCGKCRTEGFQGVELFSWLQSFIQKFRRIKIMILIIGSDVINYKARILVRLNPGRSRRRSDTPNFGFFEFGEVSWVSSALSSYSFRFGLLASFFSWSVAA